MSESKNTQVNKMKSANKNIKLLRREFYLQNDSSRTRYKI